MADAVDADWISFGRFARAHGVRGEIRLLLFDPESGLPQGLTRLRLSSAGGAPRMLTLRRARPVKDGWLVKLAEVDDRDAAGLLAGREVQIAKADLPALAPGEFYLFELIGCCVENVAGEVLGSVRATRDNGAQDLLVIDGEAGERLLPLVEGTVVRLERASRRLVVEVVDGLWEEEAP